MVDSGNDYTLLLDFKNISLDYSIMQNDMPDLDSEKLPDSKITYSFAKTEDGELIFIENATKKTRYSCWGCKSLMFKRGGEHRTDHFYHRADTCSLETAIHEAFKAKLFQIIDRDLKQNKESGQKKTKLNIRWYCARCNIYHKGNLLGPITGAELELNVDRFKPDISLYRSDRSVYAVIEIEYTHSLEEKPRQYYNENNIGIIVFKPSTIDDLRSLEIDPIVPFSCNLCKHSAKDEKNECEIIFESLEVEPQNMAIIPSAEIPQMGLSQNGDKEKVSRFSFMARFISSLFNRILAIIRGKA